jgi:hypothetical protein
VPWYWTDDLARLLLAEGKPADPRFAEWIGRPVAVRGEGEPAKMATGMLDEDEDPALAA